MKEDGEEGRMEVGEGGGEDGEGGQVDERGGGRRRAG